MNRRHITVRMGTIEEIEAERDEEWRNTPPQERLDVMIQLLNYWGKWNERRLERVARIIEVPRG